MSAKTEFRPSKESKYYKARPVKKAKPFPRYTDDDFKFVGPKKRGMTEAQKKLRNQAKKKRKLV